MNDAVRLPIVSGAFYPSRPDSLRRLLSGWLDSTMTDRTLPLTSSLGLVVPHAGYVYSGSTAAAGFAAAAALGRPDVVVILGASHTGIGPTFSLSPHLQWQTPLGRSPVQTEIMSDLRADGFRMEAASFSREHSIEVQLPFIQYVWGVDVAIIPICVSRASLAEVQDAARALARLLIKHNGLLVASSDFTHYEPDSRARIADAAAIDRILALDVSGFRSLCQKERLTICGVTAIELLMTIALERRWSRTQTVAYATSGDATGDRSSVVGYASLLMTKENHG